MGREVEENRVERKEKIWEIGDGRSVDGRWEKGVGARWERVITPFRLSLLFSRDRKKLNEYGC